MELESAFELSKLVQQEDIQICSKVQKSLELNGYNSGRFSIQSEVGVYQFQLLLKSVLSIG